MSDARLRELERAARDRAFDSPEAVAYRRAFSRAGHGTCMCGAEPWPEIAWEYVRAAQAWIAHRDGHMERAEGGGWGVSTCGCRHDWHLNDAPGASLRGGASRACGEGVRLKGLADKARFNLATLRPDLARDVLRRVEHWREALVSNVNVGGGDPHLALVMLALPTGWRAEHALTPRVYVPPGYTLRHFPLERHASLSDLMTFDGPIIYNPALVWERRSYRDHELGRVGPCARCGAGLGHPCLPGCFMLPEPPPARAFSSYPGPSLRDVTAP